MNESKTVTNLVKSIRRALRADHSIEVPHTALRASYLKAVGENPHAFGKKAAVRQEVVVHEPRRTAATGQYAKLKLHLVDDGAGWLGALALDEEGAHMLPEDFEFSSATVLSLQAEVPRISKYGLPDYLSDTAGFFKRFGMRCAARVETDVKDLGDDSGDEASIVILLEEQERTALLLRMMRDKGLTDEVAYYVAETYQLLLHQESDDKKATWFLRFLGTDEDFWFPGVSALETRHAKARPVDEPLPEGLKHVRALTFDAFVEAAARDKRVEGAFQVEKLAGDRLAILYLDKSSSMPFSQDIWFEFNPDRNTVTYVMRVVDHDAGEALAECEAELSMAKAALLLDQSIEQQLGLCVLDAERTRKEQARWN